MLAVRAKCELAGMSADRHGHRDADMGGCTGTWMQAWGQGCGHGHRHRDTDASTGTQMLSQGGLQEGKRTAGVEG